MKKTILFILTIILSPTILLSQTDSIRQLRLYYDNQLLFSHDAGLIDSINFAWVEVDQHQYVDLGLSVKWATCNVGASHPEDYGDYFAWGEIDAKNMYSCDNYKWCDNESGAIVKYNANDYTQTVLLYADDAASVQWGGKWRMPTKEEQNELINNCTWQWTNQNGVNGYRVIGNNGNSIFLPAAGCLYENTLYSDGLHGSYWSNSVGSDNSYYAYEFGFSSGFVYLSYYIRCSGQSIRPVHP